MDCVFHHVLGNVAQIQLVLGLRRLEAQLWQGKEYQAAVSQAALSSCIVWVEDQCAVTGTTHTFMFGYSGISV